MATIDEDAIRARAYQLWEEGGCVDGSHEEHWRRAQAECWAGEGGEAGEGSGKRDRVGPATLSGTDGDGTVILSGSGDAVPSAEAATVSPGIDGEISGPLIDVKSKPRRWPTPIIDG